MKSRSACTTGFLTTAIQILTKWLPVLFAMMLAPFCKTKQMGGTTEAECFHFLSCLPTRGKERGGPCSWAMMNDMWKMGGHTWAQA